CTSAIDQTRLTGEPRSASHPRGPRRTARSLRELTEASCRTLATPRGSSEGRAPKAPKGALTVYFQRVRRGGVIAVNVSSRTLRLGPVLISAAQTLGLVSGDAELTLAEQAQGKRPSVWVVLAPGRSTGCDPAAHEDSRLARGRPAAGLADLDERLLEHRPVARDALAPLSRRVSPSRSSAPRSSTRRHSVRWRCRRRHRATRSRRRSPRRSGNTDQRSRVRCDSRAGGRTASRHHPPPRPRPPLRSRRRPRAH